MYLSHPMSVIKSISVFPQRYTAS